MHGSTRKNGGQLEGKRLAATRWKNGQQRLPIDCGLHTLLLQRLSIVGTECFKAKDILQTLVNVQFAFAMLAMAVVARRAT